MPRTFGLAFLCAALCCVSAAAQETPGLSIGDKAPAIDIAHFFQGTPVKAFDKEKTYVLEFWATW
jgi:hypothetical protein